MSLTVRAIAYGGAEYEAAVALREMVLRKPLGLHYTPDDLAADATREMLVAEEAGHIVGSVSLFMETPTMLRIKQMAVDPAMQGKSVGTALLAAAEARGKMLGARYAMLHARVSALPFYAKHGYGITSDVFLEVGISHQRMEKPF